MCPLFKGGQGRTSKEIMETTEVWVNVFLVLSGMALVAAVSLLLFTILS